MPPKKPVPTKAPAARGRGGTAVRGGPAAGRGAAVGRGGPAGRGGPVKKGATPAQGAKKAPEKPKEKVWTEKDDAARKIQTKFRQYRAKKALEKKKKEKEDYNDLMDKLEKEAFVKLVQMEQEKAEKQRQKEEEERKRKREEKQRMKRMLEAAFDGDVEEMTLVLKEVVAADDKYGVGKDDVIGRALRAKHIMNVVECEDANENTPISEAASGGHTDAIKFLLERGADPNKKGQFMRTPLYRAAFAGHLEACEILLQNGGDPRIYASDGQTPEQIGSVPAIAELIQNWDITQTDTLLEKLEADKERRKEMDRQKREAETSKLEDVLKEVQEEYNIMEKRFQHAYCELQKRIYEHDAGPSMGFDKPEITLQAIQDQECEVEVLKIDLDKARDKLAMAKLKLREQQKGGEDMDEDDLPGVKVTIRELDDVLMRDIGNRIRDSGKWALIIDPNAQAATFLRYRDTNYLNTLSPAQMEPEKVRMSVLGAIRYGKPLIIDMMEVDMFHAVERRFDEVTPGLLNAIMDKSIMQEQEYLKLVKETDPPEYHKNKFNDLRTANFKLFIITKNKFPVEDLLDRTYPIRVHVPIT
ncbi:IQ motif and ankyrin repeat domain-containing protein 1-like [Ruditapes philippinarum]|uniref:IQ motif and ankyrin repeat domain-containing protein 1-like n=1 Tax=Ruditapes philippinarum TaxID=129788 RepID=UPI00295AEC72|nr:IQ motif and ankyrin repeat domain-containing protein 1-like [Ruditapes philippinarum]